MINKSASVRPNTGLTIARILLVFIILTSGSLAAGLKPGRSDDLQFETLASRMPSEKYAILLDRFGDAAEPATVIEEARKRLMKGELLTEDRTAIDDAIDDLARIDSSNRGELEKAQLSEAWKEAAFLMRRLDGPTEESTGYLEIAYSLNPFDEGLANEVKFQRSRKELVEARLAEAERIRTARDNGEDHYIGLPSIGEGSADPEVNR